MQQHRVPVDQALAAVDQAFLVQAHEDFGDGARQVRVHREACRATSRTEAPRRRIWRVMVAPDCSFHSQTRSTNSSRPEVVAVLALGVELALDHDLRGDAGVVGARLPQRVVAAHAVVAGQRVHERVLERVAHVQRAGDVRRRQQDAVGLRRRRAGANSPDDSQRS